MNKFLDAMATIAGKARSEPSWKLYADWCATRAKGLRERASDIAEQFAETARHWPYEERKRFTLWLVNRAGWAMEQCGASRFEMRYARGGQGMFAPRNVVEAVVRPTLIEWRAQEPGNPDPHFWLGLYDANGWQSLHEALRIDPSHIPTCTALALHNVRTIEYNQHELPSGYLGDPADDLATLAEVEASFAQAVDPKVRQFLEPTVASLRADAEAWIRLRTQLQNLDWDARLATWQVRSL